MCDLFSWINVTQKDGSVKTYFTRDDDVKACEDNFGYDVVGHGTIEKYFEVSGDHEESFSCVPEVLATAVNRGELDRIIKGYGKKGVRFSPVQEMRAEGEPEGMRYIVSVNGRTRVVLSQEEADAKIGYKGAKRGNTLDGLAVGMKVKLGLHRADLTLFREESIVWLVDGGTKPKLVRNNWDSSMAKLVGTVATIKELYWKDTKEPVGILRGKISVRVEENNFFWNVEDLEVVTE